MNPVVTQKCARHRSFKSTSCYINIDPKDCIDALDRTFGNEETKNPKLETNNMKEFVEMFKAWKGTWRKIELKATDTLEGLHEAIQDAIGWDNDHLYSFFMDNKFNSRDFDAEYTCPFEPEGRKTVDKAKVGMFGFKKGQKFAYLFDFGDGHRFEVDVIDFGTVDKNKDYPIILDSKGKAPEQYPDYE